ncbi:TPA: hypothetical protein NIA45_006749 [Pseudomonas aeruginosa]|nr:hypothetical protein [Pseudomonas aeruginosa]
MEHQIENQEDELAEFVTARKRELEEQQKKQDAHQQQWEEQGQQQTHGQGDFISRLQSERDRLHQAGQKNEPDGLEAEGVKGEEAGSKYADLADRRGDFMGEFYAHQVSQKKDERFEFEQIARHSGQDQTLMVCDVTPEEVRDMPRHEEATRLPNKGQSQGM